MSDKVISAHVNSETKAICMLFPEQRNDFGELLRDSFGTGFLWSHGDCLYLITNWHVVTGLNPKTKQALSENAFPPTSLEFYYYHLTKADGAGGHDVQFRPKRLELYQGGNPIWLEHPDFDDCDVVLIPLDVEDWRKCTQPINFHEQMPQITPRAADHCFAVGYPKGLRGAYDSPIWKGATIATEPDMFYEERPMFLIDTATREGMSGSPVLMEVDTVIRRETSLPKDELAGMVLSTRRKLVGVYSGRVGSENDGFQLGMVWRSSLLEEIGEKGVCRAHPLFRPNQGA